MQVSATEQFQQKDLRTTPVTRWSSLANIFPTLNWISSQRNYPEKYSIVDSLELSPNHNYIAFSQFVWLDECTFNFQPWDKNFWINLPNLMPTLGLYKRLSFDKIWPQANCSCGDFIIRRCVTEDKDWFVEQLLCLYHQKLGSAEARFWGKILKTVSMKILRKGYSRMDYYFVLFCFSISLHRDCIAHDNYN